MTSADLTCGAIFAHKVPMRGPWARLGRTLVVMAGLPGLAACVTVNAPSEPIVIELNINITQEVIYRLAEDASQTIEDNSGIF